MYGGLNPDVYQLGESWGRDVIGVPVDSSLGITDKIKRAATPVRYLVSPID